MNLDDRVNLPYTQAVLMESMRMASLVPTGLAHSVSEEVQFAGYTLPKVRFLWDRIKGLKLLRSMPSGEVDQKKDKKCSSSQAS